jgi:hypothetical protein
MRMEIRLDGLGVVGAEGGDQPAEILPGCVQTRMGMVRDVMRDLFVLLAMAGMRIVGGLGDGGADVGATVHTRIEIAALGTGVSRNACGLAAEATHAAARKIADVAGPVCAGWGGLAMQGVVVERCLEDVPDGLAKTTASAIGVVLRVVVGMMMRHFGVCACALH